ncbi:MAG TPA: hypothetical protein VGB07_30830 [Blastocatellia bacterium]
MRHTATHKLTVFGLAFSMLISLMAAPRANAQDRAAKKTDQKIFPAAGQMPGQTNKARILADAREYLVRNKIKAVRVEATQESVEQFRNDLIAILNAQRGTLIGYNLPGVGNVDTAIATAQGFTTEDLMKLKSVADLTDLKGLIVQQSQVIARSVELRRKEMAQRQQRLTAAKAAGTYPGPFPEPEYTTSICPANPQPAEALFAAGLIFLIADLVKSLAALACDQTILGFNGALVCLVTEAIFGAASFAFFYVEFCDEDTSGAGINVSYDRAEYIKDQLEFSIQNDNANKAMLSTQLTNAENHIVTNDNNNNAALSSQAASALTLTTRIAIELNLASNLTTDAAVALYQLPASRGGYLEIVRQTLIDTYNAQVAAAGAGVTVYNPSAELSLGATYTTQGRYREAYYQYRKGYRSVVKYP